MDRAFLAYYEQELSHIRSLATEFAALHPTVARNLSLESVPCPDPYVERLLEGVAYLTARTRLKIDAEASRYVRSLIDGLYPDLAGPAPAMGLVELRPGPQVDGMVDGHVVARGTRLISGLREGLTTRATFTTAQDVPLWPLQITGASYLPDRGTLKTARLPDAALAGTEAAISLKISRRGPGALSDLSLDTLDVYLGSGSRGGALFDAIHGLGHRVLARPASAGSKLTEANKPDLVGVADSEGLLPRVRPAFEGYRLVREYFLMPDRFHYARLSGLAPAIRACGEDDLEILILLDRADAELFDLGSADFRLFVTPLVNLFERECNIVEIDPRSPAHVVHADRTRPRDYEIFRILRVEDAERDGPDARILPLFGVSQNRGTGIVYGTERRPRRPGEDEIRRGQTRTSYAGDDLFISVARPPRARDAHAIRRLDIRALCTNRDLPILDDTPRLTLETGDPVGVVDLIGPLRRPRGSLVATLPDGAAGEIELDNLTWRWIAQLSLNHLSLAEEGQNAEPLRALLDLYADRGDPTYNRHARSVVRVQSKRIMERLALPGPICFGHGTEITLDVDDTVLSGASQLLLSALLARLFTRQAGINSFVRTRTHLTNKQQEVAWPILPGTRATI